SALGRPEPSVVRSATGKAQRWVTPASRAHSRSLAGRSGRQLLQGVMLGSQDKHPDTGKHSCSAHKHVPVVGIEPTAMDSESRIAAHCTSRPSRLKF
ncbi:jg27157, partial [Pararge aegeria aegeria]